MKTTQLVKDAMNNFDGSQISREPIDLQMPTPSDLNIQEFPDIDPQEIPNDVLEVVKQNINDNVHDNNQPEVELQVDIPEGIIKSQISEEAGIEPELEHVVLCPCMPFLVETYINAAFALHSDFKLHSGIIGLVGVVVGFAALEKQNCVL